MATAQPGPRACRQDRAFPVQDGQEQKDIFRDVFIELHRHLDHIEQVIELAQERLLANPHHVQSLAALAWAYGRSGNAVLQRQALPATRPESRGGWNYPRRRLRGRGPSDVILWRALIRATTASSLNGRAL